MFLTQKEIDEKQTLLLLNDATMCDSDDERAFMKESYPNFLKKKKIDKKKKGLDPRVFESQYKDLIDLNGYLNNKLSKNPKREIIINALNHCNNIKKKFVTKARKLNATNYHNLIKDKKYQCEVDFFKTKLSNLEQQTIINELTIINTNILLNTPYRLSLLQLNIPLKVKILVLQKLNTLQSLSTDANEYQKQKNWMNTFLRIPFSIYHHLPIQIQDGKEKCHNYMIEAKKTLDNCVYGHNNVKLQILQLIGQWIVNPTAIGNAIAIQGPPGSGKTSLVRDGISKILGREFAFIALGGGGDSSYLEGHSYTYEGSTWGRIIQILIETKCMNPVIYFDELDKVSDSSRGQEIIGILTHLTDTSQNDAFHDKYFSGIDFDLSKCLFIFSYNDASKINNILKDRMYHIQTNEYTIKDKIIIANKYLIPRILLQIKFSITDVIISSTTMEYIINHTDTEQGVRNLKRCLETIYTKLNLFRLLDKDIITLSDEFNFDIIFPFHLTNKMVDIFLKSNKAHTERYLTMYN